jgi:hypothetical protein
MFGINNTLLTKAGLFDGCKPYNRQGVEVGVGLGLQMLLCMNPPTVWTPKHQRHPTNNEE